MTAERRALLVVYPGFADLQVAPALDLLRGSVELVVAAQGRAPVRSEGGLAVVPDSDWATLRGQHFDLLLVPGAVDLRTVFRHPELTALLARTAPAARVVGAICGGPMLLAAAGFLSGRRYTTNFSAAQRAFLGIADDGCVDADLVVDGHLVTARGHAHGRFGLAVAELLGVDASALRRYVLQGGAVEDPRSPAAMQSHGQ